MPLLLYGLVQVARSPVTQLPQQRLASTRHFMQDLLHIAIEPPMVFRSEVLGRDDDDGVGAQGLISAQGLDKREAVISGIMRSAVRRNVVV